MRTLNANEVVWNNARFAAILTIDAAHGAGIGRGHGLHPHGGINLTEVIAHILDTLNFFGFHHGHSRRRRRRRRREVLRFVKDGVLINK